MKIKEIIELIVDDGWYLVGQKGSHKQYKHPCKKGRVTVPDHGKNSDIPKGTESSILRQAGLK
ncbi:MAG: type II toxin-antitoxin system HicA family toxin [Marinifilaceae bacterium]